MNLHQDPNAFRVLLESVHERTGYQIGVGIYGNAATKPQGGRTNEQLCEELFQGWYKSPGHNANMLDYSDTAIMVGTMTVVEYYDGTAYQYCAILGHALVAKEYLPDGLQ